MEKHYDFAAIGAGSAGFNAARLAARFSKSVALIDGARELGGLCILRGCMPSKTLIHVAEVAHQARQAARLGLKIPSVTADMGAVIARKRRIIDEFAGFRQKQLSSGGFELLRSNARFTGRNRLELEDGTVVTADRMLVGTGSRVSWPRIPGLRESRPWTSDEVLELDFVPESVIVLGGGIVACELAQFLARMGTRVVQIQRSPRVLRFRTPEASAVISQAFRDEGIELFDGTQLQAVSFDGSEYRVAFTHRGQLIERRGRHCLNALGREPMTGHLGLDAAGVALRPSGHIAANEYQQTSNPAVYAAGDCTGPHEIVHVAIQQAEVAVRHAFGQPTSPVDYSHILEVVFTDPQIASIGPAPEALERDGVPHLVASYPFNDHGKAIVMEANYGFVKVVAEPRYGRILGAEIVGRDAGELIHIFSVALAGRMTAADMLKAAWYHPTLSEILGYPLEEIAEKVSGAVG